MKSNVDATLPAREYTWSEYFGDRTQIAPLLGFVSESLERLRSGFGQALLAKAVIDLLVPILIFNISTGEHPLIKIIKMTKDKTEEEANYVGGNAATVITRINSVALERHNFRKTILLGANLTNASLRSTDFTDAVLRNSKLSRDIGRIFSISLNTNSDKFMTADSNGMIRLWAVSDIRELLAIHAHIGTAMCVDFHPIDRIVASSGIDKKIKIFDCETGECLHTLEQKNCFAVCLKFSPDGQLIVGGYDDGTLRLWNTKTGEFKELIKQHVDRVTCAVFCPDQSIIISGSHDGTINYWDMQSGQCLKTLNLDSSLVQSLALSSDETLLASSADDNIKIWNSKTGECLKTLSVEDKAHIYSIAFSPDSKRLASSDGAHTIRIWDVQNGICLKSIYAHNRMIRSIIWHPSDGLIISGSADASVKFWDAITGECLQVLQDSKGLIFSVAHHPEQAILASAGDNGSIMLWDLQSRCYIRAFQGHKNTVQNITFCKNKLASSDHDGIIKIWDINLGVCLKNIYAAQSRIWSISFNLTGQFLVSSSDASTARVWNVDTGECILSIAEESDFSISYAKFITNDLILTASHRDNENLEGKIKLWNIWTGNCLKSLQGDLGAVFTAEFHQMSSLVAIGDKDKRIRLWNIDTGERLKTLCGHSGYLRSLAFNRKSNLLASCDVHGDVRLWNIETGECVKNFKGHSTTVWSVVFNPDETRLITGSWDGTIKVWDIDSGECVYELVNRPYEGMNITGVKGLTAAEIATLKALGAVED
jgi:WD40 repeat protein